MTSLGRPAQSYEEAETLAKGLEAEAESIIEGATHDVTEEVDLLEDEREAVGLFTDAARTIRSLWAEHEERQGTG